MHFGYRIVEDMTEGLDNWMRSKGFTSIEDFRGLSLPRVTEWRHLNLNYKIVAHIDEQKCIGCDLCHIACWDGAHQCIHLDRVTGPGSSQQLSQQWVAGMGAADAAQAQAIRAQYQAWMLSPRRTVQGFEVASNSLFLILFAVFGGTMGALLLARSRKPEISFTSSKLAHRPATLVSSCERHAARKYP